MGRAGRFAAGRLGGSGATWALVAVLPPLIVIEAALRPDVASSPLTDREEDVLAAVARGLGNTEIGRQLHISLSTVKTHIASIMAKIGARNRVELAIWAHERGELGGLGGLDGRGGRDGR